LVVRSDLQLVEVEHAIGVGESEALGLVLVQRGAERGADAGADETDQIGAGLSMWKRGNGHNVRTSTLLRDRSEHKRT
jgi:hypothetical protein